MIIKGSTRNQPNQHEYKDKPMQDLRDEKKNKRMRK